ncbi:hypothetical protein C8035_v009535 [Colletotrichum spinosum]|uniref:Uncharacterized protein n=1 Tax=Colletotrichum spinosum TaxID=1347390 RepID=A0A4R8QJA2_9PEZI|nr:hypothetical protein C8035_v009535 [Colletotrichum spinosum]
MVRRTGSNGQAANANSYRDIRSFFAAGSPRKRALTASKPSVLTGSPVTEKSASQASNEHSGGNALPKARKHLAQASRIHGDKRKGPTKVQDENTTPVPEDLDGSSHFHVFIGTFQKPFPLITCKATNIHHAKTSKI